MPGGATGGASGASAFAKPAFFNPAAAQASGAAGSGEAELAEQQAGTGPGGLRGVRTGAAEEDAASESVKDANGALHWASSQALLNAEGGTASPPSVTQVWLLVC